MATIELDATQIFVAGAIWAGLWSAAGWWANHKYSTSRDRATRRRNFLGFMSGFRSWAERSSEVEIENGFGQRVHLFREQTGIIREDFREKRLVRFDEATENLCRLTKRDITHMELTKDYVIYHGRDNVCSAIDRVVEAVKK